MIVYGVKDLLYFSERSLTIVVAIILSVSAVMVMNSIGDSLVSETRKSLEYFGADIAYAYPGDPGSVFITGFSNYLDDSDIEIISSVARVNMVCPYFIKPAFMEGERVTVQSTTDECYEWLDSKGSLMLERGDRGDVVFGEKINEILGHEYDIGQSVELEGRRYRVKGFIAPGGTITVDDASVFVSFSTAKKLFGPRYAFALFRIEDDQGPVIDILKNRFRSRQVQVLTASQLAERVSFVLTAVETAVLGVGSISILVAILITFNSMHSNIIKHTRIVGLLKAIGATHLEVLSVFITQAVLLGLLGGIIGVFVSMGLVAVINYFAGSLNLISDLLAIGITINPSPNLAVWSVALSVLVSVLGAALPALQAAALPPAHALRYE